MFEFDDDDGFLPVLILARHDDVDSVACARNPIFDRDSGISGDVVGCQDIRDIGKGILPGEILTLSDLSVQFVLHGRLDDVLDAVIEDILQEFLFRFAVDDHLSRSI